MRRSATKPSPDSLNYRTLQVRSSSIDLEDRSIEILLTTETPVPTPDWERWEMVPEVLVTSGAQYPSSRQIPLLDSHDRFSTDAQLGSVRKISKGDDGIIGRATFSSTAETQWTKVREGHITDVSAGYQVLEKTYIPKGTNQTIGGRSYSGPMNVVTKWKLREGSITPIGADEQAKMRGFDPNAFPRSPKEFEMNPELKAELVKRGMDEKLSDDEAQVWMVTHMRSMPVEKVTITPVAPPPANVSGLDDAAVRKLFSEELDRREQKRAAFVAEVDSLCDLTDFSGEKAVCREFTDLTKVREHLQTKKAERAAAAPLFGAPRIESGPQQIEKHRSAVGTALVLRALNSTGAENKASIEKVFPVVQRDKNAHEFRNAGIFDIACECLRMDGFELRGLSREQIAKAAMGFPEKVGLRASTQPSYHTTGSFAVITQDAMNKSFMVGYTEVEPTWRKVFRVAQSVPDFKTIHRIRMGAIPNLPIWVDNSDPEKASFSNAQETYAVEARALEINYSWKLLVNDDMDAFGRTSFMTGTAANRTENAVAWAQVTSNPTMTDGQALFLANATGNRKRSNLTTGAGAPSVTTRQTLTNKMRQMRGENTPEGNESQDILNLFPKFIVGPTALETTINQLVLSIYDPAQTNSITFNPAQTLTPVIEPLLDAASTTAWYLFASTNQIDTVEMTYLQGQETPISSDWIDERQMSRNFVFVQTYAAKAMNHRGMQRHDGA